MKMNMRKTMVVLGMVVVGATTITGCGETTVTAQEATTQEQAQGQGGEKGEATGEKGAGQTGERGAGQTGEAPIGDRAEAPMDEAMQARGTMVVGRVSQILGNEVTIDLAEMSNDMGAMMQNRGEGEMAEGMAGGGGMTGGEMPEEMMAQRQEAMTAGGTSEEMMAQRQEMKSGGGDRTAAGNVGNAGGGMSAGTATTTTNIGDSITLTGVEETYSIPVGTAVMQYGMEMSFTQITEKMYISLMVDEDNNVLSVNVLG